MIAPPEIEPRFTADEMTKRVVVIEHLPKGVTAQELIEFFNGAVLAVTGNTIQQATNKSMSPVYAASVRDVDVGDGTKNRTADLRFRTPDGASVGMKLKGIEYKAAKLLLRRPDGYKLPEGVKDDPSVSLDLQSLTLPKLLGTQEGGVLEPAQKLSIFNLPSDMP